MEKLAPPRESVIEVTGVVFDAEGRQTATVAQTVYVNTDDWMSGRTKLGMAAECDDGDWSLHVVATR